MHRMAAKQNLGSEQRAIGRAHDQNFVSRRHCGLPYVLFVKSEIVPTLKGHWSRGRMLLGPSDRCNRARPIGLPAQDGHSLPVPGVGPTDLQSCRWPSSPPKDIWADALGANSLGSDWRDVRLFHPHFRLGFFSCFRLVFLARLSSLLFSCALERRRFPRLAFFDFVFLRFFAMIILRSLQLQPV